MAEIDRLDPGKLWLWFDTETSGLHSDLTILEFGITVTNSSLEQLTDIRSRLCAITASKKIDVLTPKMPNWDFEVNDVVRQMHQDSGLAAVYQAASLHSVMKSIEVIDQFVLDSLFSAGWDGESQFVLAGSGIAGFDRPLLSRFKSRIPSLAHYRSVDISIALEALGIPVPKTLEDVVSVLAYLEVGSITADLEDVEFEGQGGVVLHRAAGDVAVSLTIARALRLREAWFSRDE